MENTLRGTLKGLPSVSPGDAIGPGRSLSTYSIGCWLVASWTEGTDTFSNLRFEQLFTVDPPSEQLRTAGLQTLDADPPIDETAPSISDVKEAVAKLGGGKAPGICNISAELLKAGGEAMIRGLHAVLTAVWH